MEARREDYPRPELRRVRGNVFFGGEVRGGNGDFCGRSAAAGALARTRELGHGDEKGLGRYRFAAQPDGVGNLVVALNKGVEVAHAAVKLRPGYFERFGQRRRGQAGSVNGGGKNKAVVRTRLSGQTLGEKRDDFRG